MIRRREVGRLAAFAAAAPGFARGAAGGRGVILARRLRSAHVAGEVGRQIEPPVLIDQQVTEVRAVMDARKRAHRLPTVHDPRGRRGA